MDILADLNQAQLDAVSSPPGPILVLAGPGSGKTRVLTRRVAWLISRQHVDPSRILAVTFTNKAAKEMADRLSRLLTERGARGITLGTFHATCARMLRQDGKRLGIPRGYTILDADDQVRLVRQAIRDLGLDDKRYVPRRVHSSISQAKGELVRPDQYETGTYYGEVVKRIYQRYQTLIAASDALDFDDLLTDTVRLLDEYPETLAKYSSRYLHVLADEFQDTNQVQYEILRRLSSRHRSVFCVADEDQSIYRWRGADYRNLQRLRTDYPDLTTILLEKNYRSTQTVLDAARGLISHNLDRTDKALFTDRGAGSKIIVHEAYDQTDEAEYVVGAIAEMIGEEGRQPGDFAVVYRTNAQSRALEGAFFRAGLPYRLVGATRFYARREVKDVIAFLRVVHNLRESVSFERVVNVPPRGIGDKTTASLADTVEASGCSLYEAATAAVAGDCAGSGVGTRARRALQSFLDMVACWRKASETAGLAELIDLVLEDTGYEAYISDGTKQGDERWANIQELRNVAAEYPDCSLADFLADVALVSDVDSLSGGTNVPSLLTLHSAKGLEFPIVFITGLEDGILPHSRAFDEPEEMAEERRLLYVGLTRAQDRVYLTYAFRRTRFGESEPGLPSRFLDEIPGELMTGPARVTYRPDRWTSHPAPAAWEGRLKTAQTAAYAGPQFHPGDRVQHSVFGEGLVIDSRPDGGDEMVTVNFEDAGLKRLLASLASLDKLDSRG